MSYGYTHRKRPAHEIRRKKIKLVRWALYLFFILLLFGWGLNRDSLFIKNTTVSGMREIEASEMISKVNNVIDSGMGLMPNRHIFFYPREKIATILLNSSTLIRDVDVSLKNWNEIFIDIRERDSRVVWCESEVLYTQGDCLKIDYEGVVFQKIKVGTSTSLSIVSDGVPYALGEVVMESTKLLKILQIENSLEESGLDISSVLDIKNDDYEFFTNNGTRIIFNLSKNIDEAILNYNLLITSADFIENNYLVDGDFSQIDYIDLRFGRKLFYK